MIVEVETLAELSAVFDESPDAVVDFAAPAWCVPCQRFAPHYEAVSNTMEGITFVHVDIDECEGLLIESYSVQSVPTVLAFRDGAVIDEIGPEFHTAPKLTKKLNALFKE